MYFKSLLSSGQSLLSINQSVSVGVTDIINHKLYTEVYIVFIFVYFHVILPYLVTTLLPLLYLCMYPQCGVAWRGLSSISLRLVFETATRTSRSRGLRGAHLQYFVPHFRREEAVPIDSNLESLFLLHHHDSLFDSRTSNARERNVHDVDLRALSQLMRMDSYAA